MTRQPQIGGKDDYDIVVKTLRFVCLGENIQH